jgi:DNA-binding CsgD family transcriptional regulator
MLHLIFAFYLVALMAGAASLSQTFLIWQRHRKTVIRWYGFFLLSLLLILLSFLSRLYVQMAGIGNSRTAQSIVWILQAAGSLTLIVVAPYFYHSLIGMAFPRRARILCFSIDVIVFLAAIINLLFPFMAAPIIVLIAGLFGMIVYGLVLIAVKLRAIGDLVLRRALAMFLALSLFFFPFMLIDSVLSYASFLSVFHFLEGLAQPLYFLVLNCLSIAFGLRYLNRPAYAEKDSLTDYFVTTFKITAREREIIRFLLEGRGTKAIADALFISGKTVENHVYNIYQKLRIRNRVQLFQLIKANELD